MMVSYAFPSNKSEKKQDINEYRQATGKNKKNRIATSEDEELGISSMTDSMSNIENTLGPQSSDIIEYALEGIIDASDYETIPVVQRTMYRLKDVRKGRTKTGKKKMQVEDLKRVIEEEANYRNNDQYAAKQTVIHEKFVAICKKMRFSTQSSTD